MGVFVIAEAGVNHNGSEKLALELVEAAASAGANAVKFQTFKAETLVASGTATAEYQARQTGRTDQLAMLKDLELSEAQHIAVADHCRKYDIEFMSTPFDLGAARFLLELGMKRVKIPSGELTNLPFLKELTELDRPLILSTGMATMDEVREAVDVVRTVRQLRGFNEPLEQMLTVLHCTSNYPTNLEDVNLRAMQTLANELNLPIGYSDHTEGILASTAAVAMGASVIEKHFTVDRSLPGPDHKASLEPAELESMIKQIRQTELCLGDGVKAPVTSELAVRDLVRRSVTLMTDKHAGEVIRAEDLTLMRPGTGIPPKELEMVIGKTVKSSMHSGDTLTWDDLD